MASLTTYRPFAHFTAHSQPGCGKAFRTTRQHFRSTVKRKVAGRSQRVMAGLFDILLGGGSGRRNPRQEELVGSLLDAVDGTQGGLKASAGRRELIDEIVDELQRYNPRSPTRSDLFWGEYEVSYCSNPTAPGGPFRTAPGRALFWNQQLTQTLRQPDTLVNSVSFRSLGLVPGQTEQQGQLKIVDNKTYKVVLQSPQVSLTGGKPASPGDGEGIERLFEVVYLDEVVRVTRFLPPKGEDRDPTLFVFKRLGGAEEEEEEEEEEEQYEDEEEEEEEEKEAPLLQKAAFKLPSLFASAPAVDEGLASPDAPPPPQLASRFGGGTRKIGGGGTRKIGRAAPSAEATAEQDAQAQQKAAIQAQLAELSEAAQAAQAESRDLGKSLKEVEREASSSIKSAAGARSRVERVGQQVATAEQELEELQEQQSEILQQLREQQQQVRELERLVR